MERISPKQVLEYYEFIDANVTRRKKEEEAFQNSSVEKDNGGRKDIFHYLFSIKDEFGNLAYSTDELYAEANLLIIAGADTTATTMVGFWFVIFIPNSPFLGRCRGEIHVDLKLLALCSSPNS